ncbi:MAG: tRNA epoxyqueuosine(34) reductase QueG, partial [Gammaproteobacteria bacterium]|nr:tRNA epoxyqueuosine(34) reductase QueG [Gammaproteobacteria bacterium]
MNITPDNLAGLADQIRRWGDELGFQQVGFGSIDLDEDERHLEQWLAAGRHGTMDYMVRHGKMRSRPAELLPGTLSVISARMDYLPDAADAWQTLA